MSNSEKLDKKKKWIFKMVLLDAKDAKISDINQIKCIYDDSTIITTERAKNDKEESVIVRKSSDTRKNVKEANINCKRSATIRQPRARTARSKAENVPVQRNLRSSKNNIATGSSKLEPNKCDPSMPGLFDEDFTALADSILEKSPGKDLNHASEKGKTLISDPFSSDDGVLAKRSSKPIQECEPSMPDLFNPLDATGILPRKSSCKFEYEAIPEKIKKRRVTIGHFTMNHPKLVQPILQENKNVAMPKGARQKTGGKTNTPSFDQKDPQRELLESLAQGRKHFFETFTRNKKFTST